MTTWVQRLVMKYWLIPLIYLKREPVVQTRTMAGRTFRNTGKRCSRCKTGFYKRRNGIYEVGVIAWMLERQPYLLTNRVPLGFGTIYIQEICREAAEKYGIPYEILMAIAHRETEANLTKGIVRQPELQD